MLQRDGVVRTIGKLLDGARQGRGGCVFVVGEAGMGRTTVLEHACKLGFAHFRVGLARGDPMETALAFGLVTQIVDDLGGSTLLGNETGDRPADDVRASRFYEVLGWLRETAERSPVLLAFDDLHWGDPDSLALLSFLCRRLERVPVAVVATLRPWPPRAEEVALSLAETAHAVVERLDPLGPEAAAEVLTMRLGRRPPPEVLAQACEATGGNPCLLELVALDLGNQRSPGADGEPAPSTHPVARALVLRGFSDLPGAALALARAASALGRAFRPDVAAELARLDQVDLEAALDALGRSRLIRSAGLGVAEFTYPLLREALYEESDPLLRDQLHARAFRLLSDRGMDEEAVEQAMRGSLSGDAGAVAVLVRAGQSALRAGAVGTAVERLERAADLAGGHASAASLLPLGEAYMAAGRGDRAVAIYERVLGQPDLAREAMAEARRLLGRALFLAGEVLEGERRLEEAAALSEEDPGQDSVRALLDLSRAAWLTAGPAGALPAAVRAREAGRAASEGARLETEAAWGFVAFVAGDPAGLEATEAAGSRAAGGVASVLRDLAWSWGTLRNTGRAAKYAERFDQAEAVFEAMFAEAERTGSPHAIASLAAHHADTLLRRGRLDQARSLASHAVALAELAPMAAAFAYAAYAAVQLHIGRLDDSDEACDRAEFEATARGQWLPLMRVWHLRAVRHVDDGRPDLAAELFAMLEAETERLGIGEPCLVPWARHGVVTLVGDGRHADARRVQAAVEAAARRLPCRWPRIAADVGRAVLAEAGEDGGVAADHLGHALVLHEEVDLPLEHVETLLHLGAHLRRTGRVVEGRASLRQALDLAGRTGSVWLSGLVEKELTVAGGRRRSRSAPDSFTPQEQRVADLAAAGRSCREIAGQLSLSTRTIETHLRRIYAKLGIHSQRELMARTRPDPVLPGRVEPPSENRKFT